MENNKSNSAKIIIFSDTHGLHENIQKLQNADIIICAGDISHYGFQDEILDFCQWYDNIKGNSKIFIPGNHDFGLQINPKEISNLLKKYKSIHCLIDEIYNHDEIKIYGSPYTPLSSRWAYGLQRDSTQLKKKWEKIPKDTDILITHSPAYGILDSSENDKTLNFGCKLLLNKIKEIKPKIHICGHIHTGSEYQFDGNTHFINASIINEQNIIVKKPFIIEWNKETNEISFL